MEKPFISVIIPAYNAKNVLERCVQSVLKQSYTNFEMILVDDGSKDGTSCLADELGKMDNRIQVVHKGNGGVSETRNLAVQKAKGEWITFIDADDWVDETFLRTLVTGDRADLIVAGYKTVGAHEIREANYDDVIVDSCGQIKCFLEKHLTDMTFLCPWGKLFRTSIIRENHLAFDTRMRIGEDVVFVWSYLSYCKSIAVKNGQPYNYYTEEGTDFKYASDETVVLYTLNRIFSSLQQLVEQFGIDETEARDYMLNYYIWLYKLYIKKCYEWKDVSRIGKVFYHPVVLDYFQRNKWKSKDKLLVWILLKLHLTGVLYRIIKLYY